MITMVPKAELHCHLEGAASPDLVRKLAARHAVTLPAETFDADGNFAWDDFLHFLKVYDIASSVIRTPEDYRDVTYQYLMDCAAEGAIYVEVMSSPDHAAAVGMSYTDHLEGIAAGIEDARSESGIEGRIIVTCVRHLGPERGVEVARQVVANPHKLVTGFGMGGDENAFEPRDFAPAFGIVHATGLPCTVHAGEVAGAQSVRAALEALPVQRLGHGVRAMEDPELVRELADRGIVLEVCPGSNIATGVYGSYSDHPLLELRAAGCRITLNSDDPPYFDTTIGREYDRASAVFGFDDASLREVTLTAIEAAFVDEETRENLRQKVVA
ncbi:adenosine deaminase [Pelagibius sp. Alg239-R121]|uniref:adenosine deaminase n=1 Tax=Pelagibius sp. Alg239-R121 TaxID=2993448 RepID=UPI002AC31327|nr:adenosine deaminase [Pelagibius sp. Alg239-R121]